MKQILKLSLSTVWYQKMGLLMVFLVAIVPFILPYLTDYEVNQTVIEPARAQAAWKMGWVACIFWLLYQSASLGGEYTRSAMGAYFTSKGVAKGGQLTALWGAGMVYGFLLCLVPAIISWCAARPSLEIEAQHWGVLCVQHFCLMLLLVSSLSMLSVALASRMGTVVGYLFTVGLMGVGYYGVTALEKIVMAKDVAALDVLYGVLPHFYLADLTHRFVHKQGALTTGQFMGVFEYVVGWSILLVLLSMAVFSTKQK